MANSLSSKKVCKYSSLYKQNIQNMALVYRIIDFISLNKQYIRVFNELYIIYHQYIAYIINMTRIYGIPNYPRFKI